MTELIDIVTTLGCIAALALGPMLILWACKWIWDKLEGTE